MTVVESTYLAIYVVGTLIGIGFLLNYKFKITAAWRDRREEAKVASMGPEERELYEAEREYNRRVDEASKVLANAQAAYDASVRDVVRRASAAEKIGLRRIATFVGSKGDVVTLNEYFVWTAQGVAKFRDGPVSVTVDASGSCDYTSRTSPARVALGGALFGPAGAIVGAVAKVDKAHDHRKLYLRIEAPSLAVLVECKPDDETMVRRLAMQIEAASRNWSSLWQQRDDAIAIVNRDYLAAKADTKAIDLAAEALANAKLATSRVDAARAVLAKRG